ncbi:unnamed protein product [marine sediment metagenome]|uniref:Uncharacterized protein n=1 Tax=marine sediment metagenome TaxID=412755 RepID=X0V6E3_9ZZZZ
MKVKPNNNIDFFVQILVQDIRMERFKPRNDILGTDLDVKNINRDTIPSLLRLCTKYIIILN